MNVHIDADHSRALPGRPTAHSTGQGQEGLSGSSQLSREIRIRMVSRSLGRNPWLELQDVIPRANTWPLLVRRKFWCSNLTYPDRCFIAAFGFQNGVSPDLLCDVLYFTNNRMNARKEIKIRDLYNYWEGDTEEVRLRRSRYFAFDFVIGRVVDLNGQPRVYGDNVPPTGNTSVGRVETRYHC